MNQTISNIFYTLTLMLGILILSIGCETGSPCDPVDCVNGTCAIDTMGNPICVCWTGYSGERCEIDICGSANPCQNGAVCEVTEDGTVTCICPDGYMGDTCGEVDSCFNVVCVANSFCENGECLCLKGYDEVGDSCIALSAKFVGKYTYVDVCTSVDATQEASNDGDLEIVADPSDPTKFLIQPFHQFNSNGIANNDEGTIVTASVLDIKISNTMKFAIPLQSETTGDIYKSITQGILTESANSKVIEIEYTAERSNYTYQCELVLTAIE